MDNHDWPERVGYFGLRGGKLAKPPYDKCVAIFKKKYASVNPAVT